jgi:hypothetical protein
MRPAYLFIAAFCIWAVLMLADERINHFRYGMQGLLDMAFIMSLYVVLYFISKKNFLRNFILFTLFLIGVKFIMWGSGW